MRRLTATLLFLSVCLGPAAFGQNAIDPKILDALRKAAPGASWDDPLSAVADVACDGNQDTIVVGRRADVVWLGIVPTAKGRNSRKPITMSWPIGHPIGENAFCAKPVHLDVYPLKCQSPDGSGDLPGCKPVKGCQGFSIYDEECDAFLFYWNSRKGSLALWRE